MDESQSEGGGRLSTLLGRVLPEREAARASENRSRDRYRRASLTAVTGAVAKVVAVGASLITVPITLHYLGNERYGLWMTITSITALLAFADFGIGNGLLNAVADANGRDDRHAASLAVSSGTAMLLAVAVIVITVFVVADAFVSWGPVLGVSTVSATREAGPAILVFAGFFAVNLPLGVVQRVQYGYQQGYIVNLWQILGSLLGLGFVLLAVHMQAGLAWLVAALAGGPVVGVTLNWLTEFIGHRRWLLPRPRLVRRSVAHSLLKVGALFFVLQLTVAVGYATDNIVIARVLGSDAVPDYAVPFKLFALVGAVVTLAFGPLWPAYGEASARGDAAWVERTLVRSLIATFFVAAIPCIILVVAGPAILDVWVGSDVTVSIGLLVGMAVWTLLWCLGATLAMFLNGVGLIRIQALLAVAMAASSLALKIVLAGRMGVTGVAWAMVIAYSVFTALPLCFYVPRKIRQLRRGEAISDIAK